MLRLIPLVQQTLPKGNPMKMLSTNPEEEELGDVYQEISLL